MPTTPPSPLRAVPLMALDLLAAVALYWLVSRPLGILMGATALLLLVAVGYQLSRHRPRLELPLSRL